MLRGFYTAASGMIAQQQRTEMLTNNMANANTPGFKQDQSSLRAFPKMLMERMESGSSAKPGLNLPGSSTIGEMNTGVYVQEMPHWLISRCRLIGQPELPVLYFLRSTMAREPSPTREMGILHWISKAS